MSKVHRWLRAVAVLLLAAGLVGCQSSRNGAPEPTLVVEGGRVIVGDGPVLEEASVVVAGDSILEVTREPVDAPAARRIDASGKTVLPGLIDAHVHLLAPTDMADSAATVEYMEGDLPGALRDFLRRGVTTVRSTGDYWPWIGDIRDRVTAGDLRAPRIVTAGPVFMPEGPHPVCQWTQTSSSEGSSFCESIHTRKVSKPKAARERVRGVADEGVDFIKVISDERVFPGHLKPAVVEAIVDQAHREGLRVIGHVDQAELMRKYARMGMDGFVHLPLEDTSAYQPQRLARGLGKQATPVTSTLSVRMLFGNAEVGSVLAGDSPKRDEIETRSEHATILAEAGVPIVAGTDWSEVAVGETDHPAVEAGAATVTEMQMLRWGGMSREAIIEAATANGARTLEMDDRIGTLEPGKLADLIVVDGNPLEDLSALENVEAVVQGGTVVTRN